MSRVYTLEEMLGEEKQLSSSKPVPVTEESHGVYSLDEMLGTKKKPPEERKKGLMRALGFGMARGVTTELPSMVGGAAEFVGEKTGIQPLEDYGRAVKEWGEEKGKDWFGDPAELDGLERIVFEGSSMLAPSLIPGGLATWGFRGLMGLKSIVTAAKVATQSAKTVQEMTKASQLWATASKIADTANKVGAGSAGVLFGLSQAQSTIDNANQTADALEAEGKMEEAAVARAAGQGVAPYLTGAIEATGEYFGTKYLQKLFGMGVGKKVVKDVATGAGKVTIEAGGRSAKQIALDFLKTLGVEVGTEVGQAGSQAAVEKAMGVRPTASPWQEALDVIGPTAFMTLLTGGFASAVGRIKDRERDAADQPLTDTGVGAKDISEGDLLEQDETEDFRESIRKEIMGAVEGITQPTPAPTTEQPQPLPGEEEPPPVTEQPPPSPQVPPGTPPIEPPPAGPGLLPGGGTPVPQLPPPAPPAAEPQGPLPGTPPAVLPAVPEGPDVDADISEINKLFGKKKGDVSRETLPEDYGKEDVFFEGDNYVIKEQKPKKGKKKTFYTFDLTPDAKEALKLAEEFASAGAPNKAIRIDKGGRPGEGGAPDVINIPSTYPEFFKGRERKEILNAINKAINGERLEGKQLEMVQDAIDWGNDFFDEQEKARLKDAGVDGKVIEEVERTGEAEADEDFKKEVAGAPLDEKDLEAIRKAYPGVDLTQYGQEDLAGMLMDALFGEPKLPEKKGQTTLLKGQEPEFKLTPSEPTPQEDIQNRKDKGEIVAPEKGEKPGNVFPDQKIQAPTSGKQRDIFGRKKQKKGQSLDIEDLIEEKKKPQLAKDTVEGEEGNMVWEDKDGKLYESGRLGSPTHAALPDELGLSFDDVVRTGIRNERGEIEWNEKKPPGTEKKPSLKDRMKGRLKEKAAEARKGPDVDADISEIDKLFSKSRASIGELDPDMYAKVKAILDRAWEKAQNAKWTGEKFVDVYFEKMGPEATPYFEKWIDETITEEEEGGKAEQEGEGLDTGLGEGTGTGGRTPAPAAGGEADAGGGQKGVRPGLRVASEELLPQPPDKIPAGQYKVLGPEQRFAVNLALDAFDRGKRGFLLADGTGVGKTMQILVIAKETAKKTGKPSLIITQNEQIIKGNFRPDAKALGIDLTDIEIGTYDGLRVKKAGQKDYGVVLFDEAHNLKNIDTAKTMASETVKADHRLFATATPMDKPTGATYFLSQITGIPQETLNKRLGFTVREIYDSKTNTTNKYTVLMEGYDFRDIMDNLIEMRNQAIKDGTLIRREYPFFGNLSNMTKTFSTMLHESEKEIWNYWERRIDTAPMGSNARRNLSGQRTIELGRWTESKKVDWVYGLVQEDLKAGKHVVVVAEGINETLIKGLNEMVPGFITAFGNKAKADNIDFAKIYGGKKGAAAEIERFQKGEAQLAILSPKTGGAGINLDDTLGDKPRKVYIVTPNFAGDVFQQILGRFSRRNTKSPSEIRFTLFSDAFSDQRRIAIAEKKMETLRAIQEGKDLDVAYGFEETGEQGEDTDKGPMLFGDEVGERAPPVNVSLSSERHVKEWLKPILDQIKGDYPVSVVQSLTDVPAEALIGIPKDALVKAVYSNTKDGFNVYLIADNIKNGEEAQGALIHELFRHYGLRYLLGDKFDDVLREVYEKYGDKEELKALAKDYKLDLRTKEDQLIAAEEFLAHMGEKDVGFLKKILVMVRDFLKGMGFSLELTEGDLAVMLHNASRAVIEGKALAKEFKGNRFEVSAWHGSPHAFEKFATDKIGTGEGAQAFGWGLYFTDLESIGRHYADQQNQGRSYIDGLKAKYEGAWNAAYNALQGKKKLALEQVDDHIKAQEEYIKRYGAQGKSNEFLQICKDLKKAIEADRVEDIKKPRNLYKVTLHKGKKPGEYTWLDWEKAVSKATLENIRKKMESELGTQGIQGDFMDMFDRQIKGAGFTGQKLYNWLSDPFLFKDEKGSSLFLLSAGIDGIRYPAGSLSGQKPDANNYVVFDENAVTIENVTRFLLSTVDIDPVNRFLQAPPTGAQVTRDLEQDRTFVMKLFEMVDPAVTKVQVQVQKLQRQVQKLAGKPSRRKFYFGIGYQPKYKRSQHSDDLDRAMYFWRDTGGDATRINRFRTEAQAKIQDPQTKPEQRIYLKETLRILDLTERLTPEQKDFALMMGDFFDDAARVANQHGLLRTFVDNYVRRIYDLPEEKKKQFEGLSQGSAHGFKTFFSPGQPRSYTTTLDAILDGYEIAVSGITNSYAAYMTELVTVIADKAFIHKGMQTVDANGNKLFTTNEKSTRRGYKKLDAPGFQVYEWIGEIEAEKDLPDDEVLTVNIYGGRKVFATIPENIPEMWAVYADATATRATKLFKDEQQAKAWAKQHKYTRIEHRRAKEHANLFRKTSLYAAGPLADMINKATAKDSLFWQTPFLETIKRMNAGVKGWILMSSFFHHLAGTRSWVFGVHHGWKKVNPIRAYKDGLKKIEDLHPLVMFGVKNGLTLGEIQDWSEYSLAQNKGLTEKLLTRFGLEKPLKVVEYFKFKRQGWADSLFKRYFAGLKAEAFAIEYAHELQKATDAYSRGRTQEAPNPDRIAERVARLINADFGGLHLKRMGRNPTLQNMARLLLLAPDWTESNFRVVTGMVPGLNAKISNLVGDIKPPPGMEDVYRKFMGRVMLRIAVMTIIAQLLLNGADDSEEFIEEQMLSNRFSKLRWAEVDITKLYRMMGIDTEGQRKTFSLGGHFFDPLKLMDPFKLIKGKGSPFVRAVEATASGSDWAERPYTGIKELVTTGKTVKKSIHQGKEGDLDRLPSVIVNQVVNMQPIQVGHLIKFLQGEEDALTALLTSAGAATHTAWKPRLETPIVGPKKGTDAAMGAVQEMMKVDSFSSRKPPSRYVTIKQKSYKMSREQYDRYLEESSGYVRRRLNGAIENGMWGQWSEDTRAKKLTSMINNSRKKTRDKIEREMRRQILEGKLEPTKRERA